ncbi:class I SAM-dependent methyltransferase [Chloroflexota bacterium]
MRKYEPENYWQERLSKNFSLGGVGHSGFGQEYNKWLYKARIRALNKFVKNGCINPQGKSLLDIGCGTGFYIDYWERLGVTNIVGLDITEISISRLSVIHPGYRFLRADITADNLELKNGFDTITAFDVLFHIVEEDKFEQAISNIRSNSHQNTRILIMDNFLSWHRSPGFHENDRTFDSYQEVLEKNGLEMKYMIPIFYFMGTPIDLAAVKNRLRRTTLRYSWFLTSRLISLGNKMRLPGRIMNYLLGGFLYILDGIVLKYAKDCPCTKLLLAQPKNSGQRNRA